MAVGFGEIAGALRELIAALDRRAPRAERAGEAAIARDSAALRERAVDRLEQIGDQPASPAIGAPDRAT